MTPTEIRAAIAALELKIAPLLTEIARLEEMLRIRQAETARRARMADAPQEEVK